jgi:hypothetical protein
MNAKTAKRQYKLIPHYSASFPSASGSQPVPVTNRVTLRRRRCCHSDMYHGNPDKMISNAPKPMRDAFRLSVIVGKAALIVTAGFCALMLGIFSSGFNPQLKSVGVGILVAVAVFLTIGVATGWMFRKLRTVYPRREARAVSTAFGVFTPASLVVSVVLAQIPGGYAEMLAGPHFALIGVFVGLVGVTGFLSVLLCALVLRVTQLIISVEQSD